MIAGRRYLRNEELAALDARAALWPAASLTLLCVLAVLLPSGALTAMNLYLLALCALMLLARQQAAPAGLRAVLWPLLAVMVVGLLSGAGAPPYLYLKDAWYVSNPGVLVAVGYVLARLVNHTPRLLRAFVWGGTLVAIGHVLWFAIHPELLRLQATQIRSISGTGYYAAALGVLILAAYWGRWREELALGPWLGSFCLVLCSASVIFSFSRTLLLVVLMGALALSGFFSRREWLRIGLALGALALALWLLPMAVDTDSWEARSSFLGKLARSAQELAPTERMTVQQINDNWRGYETARAFNTWALGEPWRWMLGQGFGAQVDLGLFQNLSRNPRDAVRFIPIFHNGYIFLLVKTGLVGVLLYLGLMLGLYRLGRRHAADAVNTARRRLGRLMQACAVVLAVTTWVIAGAFNKFDLIAFMLMIGALIHLLEQEPAT